MSSPSSVEPKKNQCPTCQGTGTLTAYLELCKVAEEVDRHEQQLEAVVVALTSASARVREAGA